MQGADPATQMLAPNIEITGSIPAENMFHTDSCN